jgi:Na+-transporting methylmalonyl-CoA/oxaloacetate decarboxylase gamma subunit
MKKIAFIFLLVFSLVQVMPAITALYADSIAIFMVDEEKSEEKNQSTESKDKKIFSEFPGIAKEHSHKLNTALHLAEKINPSPFL